MITKTVRKRLFVITLVLVFGLVFLGTSSVYGQGPFCGPMDVVFVIDTTGSMAGAFVNVQTEATALIADIDTASGGDFQLGLVTFPDDNVVVHQDLAAGNAAAVEADILALSLSFGGGYPEASDEALNTVVNGLDEADRLPGQQTGDFNGVWRPEALKIAILITDAPPGGFDDAFTAGVDDVNAHQRAVEAAGAGILISAVYVDFNDPVAEAIMQDYAATTGGVYIETSSDGTGTADAIVDIIAACGEGQPTVDLAVTKTDSPDPVLVGNNLAYTVTVTNNGPWTATGVTLTDTLPSSMIFASATNCTEAGGTVTCDLGDLASGASATVTIVVTPTTEGMITNTVSVMGNEHDPNTANNTATEDTTVIPQAISTDLAVTQTDSPDPVIVGNDLTYTIIVTNTSPWAATGVTLTDALPAGVTLVSATPSQGNCSGTNTVTCNLGDLFPGASATVTIVVIPTTEGTITNVASVTGNETDPDPTNNTDTEDTRVVQPQPPEPEEPSPAAVPEASTLLLLGSGLASLAGYAGLRLRARRQRDHR